MRRRLAMGMLLVLAAVQLAALRAQVAGGFVPFVSPPVRVPFSWDMFSVRIERCTVDFAPPLEVDGKTLRSFADRGPGIEWDTVFDQAAHYRIAALGSCAFAQRPTLVTLRCFLPDGHTTQETTPCPPSLGLDRARGQTP